MGNWRKSFILELALLTIWSSWLCLTAHHRIHILLLRFVAVIRLYQCLLPTKGMFSMVNCLVVRKMEIVRLTRRAKLINSRVGFRHYSDRPCKRGLLIGTYIDEKGEFQLSKAAQFYNNVTSGKLCSLVESTLPDFRKGSTRIFYDLVEDYSAVSVVGIGPCNAGYDEQEELDQGKENVREAAAAGARALREVGMNDIEVECLGDAEAAAEGVTLQLWQFEEFKSSKKKKSVPLVRLKSFGDQADECSWALGLTKAEAQNLARRLTDTPANMMTPTLFAEEANKLLCNDPRVTINVRDDSWARQMKMFSFLSVAQGSTEPAVFLEIHYKGRDSSACPVVLVGKGVTFDSGGLCIKPASGARDMRGDMGGGACVLATIHAAAKLQLPHNIIGLIPLCENMVEGKATKPGDVVFAMNGKSIEVINTDAEGRLILADALHYAQSFNPRFVMDIATLTGAMRVALGGVATGVFTNSTPLWNLLHSAGVYTGDRMWRFPLWDKYTKRMTDSSAFDVVNVATQGAGGGACTAAAFLREFAPEKDWMHLDIAGVMGPGDDSSYIKKGMTGRPTRTLIEMLRALN